MKRSVGVCLAIFCTWQSVAYAQELTNGLCAYWAFDGNLGERIGDYHAGNRGEVRALFSPGRFDQALQLNGNETVVESLARNDGTLDTYHVSIALWVWIEKGGTILDKGSCSWSLSYDAEAGQLEFGAYWGVDSYHGVKSFPGLGLDDGQWHHVVCVSRSWELGAPIFVDGEAAGQHTSNAVSVQGRRFPLAIGGHPERSRKHGPFVGAIDELMIWERPLTLPETEALWNDGRGTTLDDLLPDTDADGMPDAWEQRKGLNVSLADDEADLDSDGLTNLEEFRLGTHPRQSDTDRDGLNDRVETDTGDWVSSENTGTSPVIADTDGDGLDDGREDASGIFVSGSEIGTHPLQADSDGDGFTDGGEVSLGTDPTEKLSTPSLVKDLLAYYPFDGELSDDLGGDAGEWAGESARFTDPLFAEAAFGRSLVFEGEAAVRLPPRPEFAEGPFTISMWYRVMRAPASSFDRYVLASYGEEGPWRLAFQASSSGHPLGRGITFVPKTLDPKARSVSTMEDDRLWHHLAASYDPETDRTATYIDGAPQPKGSENAYHPYLVDLVDGFVLGGLPSSDGLVTDGLFGNLDDLAIWSRILHPAEVRVLSRQRQTDTSFGDLLEKQRLADAPQDDDEDGMPDRWESAIGLQPTTNDSQDDLDGDGLTNFEEFMRQTHPGKTDTDGDTVPDAAETNSGTWTSLQDRGTDPNIVDSDGDGLTDGEEILTPPQGSDPNVPDTDEDGINDATERLYGSLPGDAASTPALGEGLLAYLPFDESLSETYGGTRARWANPEGGRYEEGRFGQAAWFDGRRQFVELQGGSIGQFDFSNRSFTVSLWHQSSHPGSRSPVLISQGGLNGWQISRQGNELRVDTYRGYVSLVHPSFRSNGFDHLVMVVSPELRRTTVYVNGRKLGLERERHPDALTPFIETVGEPLILGNGLRPWEISDFSGLLDEVAIWERALSEQEIFALCESNQSLAALANLHLDGDGDGSEDFREQFAGTDPSLANDFLGITSIRRLNGEILLEWPTKPGRLYHVQHAPAIANAPWQTITPAPLANGAFTDPSTRANEPTGYYRVTAVREDR